MSATTKYLESKFQDILPPSEERSEVQSTIDTVRDHVGAAFPIAELHPSGSWAKRTMLAGRKEADLVMFMAEAPDSHTLDTMASHLGKLENLSSSYTSHKAVQLTFDNGVSIDVLPVAEHGVTPDGPSIPKKLRYARFGPDHVRWYKDNVRGKRHQTVCLLKHARDCNSRQLGGLFSFAIEVMAAEMNLTGNLAHHFKGALQLLADSWLMDGDDVRHLSDPVVQGRNLLENLSEFECQRIARCANDLVRSIQADTWSQVFPGARVLPGPASNLGGRTLA